ncbi:MAG: hypothetical protein QOJ39_1541 [Candidatus Eremiobacteraeota bacterium]|nr:hypothetical protein [Candidatus Eremiobacteraeota bacterium]
MTAAAPARDAGEDDSLATSLTGAPWIWYAQPFPHVVARNVFVPDVQAQLEAGFGAVFDERVRRAEAEASALPADGKRAARRYDADIVSFAEHHRGLFPVLLDAAFHRMLARLMDVRATGDIDGGIHHHVPGSATGWVHNDLNPGWFTPSDRDVNLPDHARGGYKTGRALDGIAPVMRVRAAALIYFLGNGSWRDGDGGETGLYAFEKQPVGAPSKRIAPIDNSLLSFRCTPHSYHAFLSNVRSARRSIILWLHEDVSAADARWGRGSLVGWG